MISFDNFSSTCAWTLASTISCISLSSSFFCSSVSIFNLRLFTRYPLDSFLYFQKCNLRLFRRRKFSLCHRHMSLYINWNVASRYALHILMVFIIHFSFHHLFSFLCHAFAGFHHVVHFLHLTHIHFQGCFPH